MPEVSRSPVIGNSPREEPVAGDFFNILSVSGSWARKNSEAHYGRIPLHRS